MHIAILSDCEWDHIWGILGDFKYTRTSDSGALLLSMNNRINASDQLKSSFKEVAYSS